MTVKELKSGVEFKYKGSKYTLGIQDNDGDVNEGEVNYYVCNYGRYCGNVKSIDETTFTIYTFVMSVYIEVIVELKSCKVIISEQ